MLDALGNLGDLISGIGVVITLGYLAVQIRHSSRVAALTAGHSISLVLWPVSSMTYFRHPSGGQAVVLRAPIELGEQAA